MVFVVVAAGQPAFQYRSHDKVPPTLARAQRMTRPVPGLHSAASARPASAQRDPGLEPRTQTPWLGGMSSSASLQLEYCQK